MTRIVGSLLPDRLYHWLVVFLARLPLTPPCVLPHSVVLRHPLHPRSEHYVLVPTEYSPGILDLPRPTARPLQDVLLQWISTSGWRFVLIVANFGAY